MCPSSGPLLQRVVRASLTASRSRLSARANCFRKRNPDAVAFSIQVFNRRSLRHLSMARNCSAAFEAGAPSGETARRRSSAPSVPPTGLLVSSAARRCARMNSVFCLLAPVRPRSVCCRKRARSRYRSLRIDRSGYPGALSHRATVPADTPGPHRPRHAPSLRARLLTRFENCAADGAPCFSPSAYRPLRSPLMISTLVMSFQPGRKTAGGSLRQQIDLLVSFQIHQQSAIALLFAPSPIVHSEHSRRGPFPALHSRFHAR